MKYFALLTKLGENLLAQATALGTKLELTHMAVGDGGGSLPTPDTNQTKLIAEKRRAAINTLFIDDKNKNQIIAEQIIPEQDGGWWIREIGLFDKAGNLIAVANCPETYKPQLAEGSGRTQSIRIVLIVSHTESVTLKIDPSVVLATREYVNTEITVLDKKIDVLSAQTKLDLNKKFDKANISGQKGNDNDKVPSLNLFTTEIGKLAALGYSYSKIESDGRYQPKGNYAPAGDYATNTALTNGLNGKFDKTGGQFNVDGEGVALRNTTDNKGLTLGFRDKGNILRGYLGFPSELNRLSLINSKTGKALSLLEDGRLTYDGNAVMTVGNFGLGAEKKEDAIKETDFGINKRRTFGVFYHDSDAKNTPNGHQYGGGIFFGRDPAVSTHMLYSPDWSNRLYMRSSKSASTMNDWAEFYSTEIAKSDRNGHLKRTNFPDELSDYPVGAPIPWPQATAPSGYLVCNGQSFNKTTYPLLAKAYPTGVLPDLRGEFIRGVDYGRGIDANRTVLSAQGDAIRNITGQFANNGLSTYGDAQSEGVGAFTKIKSGIRSNREVDSAGCLYSFDASKVVPTANENRPRNIAFLYIVRAA
ncbi:phage tail-collar fiber domain-containing protein [Providencia rettgeri]|uniref:phage tail-collar fiber domain-containing protein n=1 Tax=Providencia rettgeri TaxID=587 RepID=UPI00226E37CC|nr:phage tail protein [Providencia rettgeri]MCX9116007.1 phage tail protein [Providencia rettgeri]